MAFVCQVLAAHIPPGAPSWWLPNVAALCKNHLLYPWGVLRPLHQVTSWGEGAVFHPRQGFEAQRGAGTLQARA